MRLENTYLFIILINIFYTIMHLFDFCRMVSIIIIKIDIIKIENFIKSSLNPFKIFQSFFYFVNW